MTINDDITQFCDFDLQPESAFDLQPERDRGVVEPASQADLDGAHPQEDLVSKDGCLPTALTCFSQIMHQSQKLLNVCPLGLANDNIQEMPIEIIRLAVFQVRHLRSFLLSVFFLGKGPIFTPKVSKQSQVVQSCKC